MVIVCGYCICLMVIQAGCGEYMIGCGEYMGIYGDFVCGYCICLMVIQAGCREYVCDDVGWRV